MFLVDYTTPANAQGPIKAVYENFPEAIGLPAPLLVMSASPGLFERQAQVMGYFSQHPRMEPLVLASIRYVIASLHHYAACIEFNGALLMGAGFSQAELDAMVVDPMTAPFTSAECHLISFAKRAILTPETVHKDDIKALTRMGWEESDLVDAVYQGAAMHIAGALAKTFSE